MKNLKKSYYNVKWFNFAKKVRQRDGHKCVKCHRNRYKAILQVHHKRYFPNLNPWDYSLSDCITLCKGCHANEHKKIEPTTGWVLIAINDLGSLDGICERKGCGTEIRYEHEAYHPDWGYKIIGSSCIEFLTQEDKWLSKNVLKIYSQISSFVHRSKWENGITKNKKEYLTTKWNHNILRIYGKDNSYAFQIAIKMKDEKWHIWKDIIYTKRKNLNQTKELAFIVVKGLTSKNEEEKEILRNVYRKIR